MAFVDGFPTGFYASVEYAHDVPEEALSQISADVARSVTKLGPRLSVTRAMKIITDNNGQLPTHGVESLINMTEYIFRVCLRDGIEGNAIVKGLRARAAFGDVQAKALATAWHHAVNEARENAGEGKPFDLLSVGQLKEVIWSTGVAVSSSVVKQLRLPIVNLRFVVVEPSGEEVTRTVELTIEEFKDFAQKARDALSIFEAV